jgi:cytochrome c oxidase subunit IV
VGSHQEAKHASVKLYVVFAVALCAITFMEWGVFKMEGMRAQAHLMIPILLVLSVAKFVMVCGWYMHLRYDHSWLWKMFAFALFLSGIVFTIVHFALIH